MIQIKNPYLPGAYFESESGESIELSKVWTIANKTLAGIVSELPEEARTHDVIARVLKEASQQLNGIKVSL